MFCPNCGKELPKDTIRCSYCKAKNWPARLGDGVPLFTSGAIFLFSAYIAYVFIKGLCYFPSECIPAHKAWTLPLFIYGTILLTLFASTRIAKGRLQKKTSFCHKCGKNAPKGIVHCPQCQNIDNLAYWDSELCLVFGIITLFGAVLSYIFYVKDHVMGIWYMTIFPFRDNTLLLLIPGIAFLIIYTAWCIVLRRKFQKKS